MLTNITIYWLTDTAASSMRLYYEDFHTTEVPSEPTTVPLGLSSFANDYESIRPFAEREHKNIISWNVYNTGDHFMAHSAPDLLVEAIRGFFQKL